MLIAGRFVSTVARAMSAKPWVIFVLGGPGAGKGTQCGKIVQEFGYVHLSAGDLLREERANPDSSDGKLIDDYIKEGKIVPVEITINLLMKRMRSSEKNKFLIDGFPRNKDNLEGWEREVGDKADLKFVLFFDCPGDVCVARIMERGRTSGRTDDNEESLKKRFRTYEESTKPIIQHYEAKGMVRTVLATPSPDEVFEEVKKLFSDL